jgi:hypothetical protein
MPAKNRKHGSKSKKRGSRVVLNRANLTQFKRRSQGTKAPKDQARQHLDHNVVTAAAAASTRTAAIHASVASAQAEAEAGQRQANLRANLNYLRAWQETTTSAKAVKLAKSVGKLLHK